MKILRDGRHNETPELQYVRYLALCSATAATIDSRSGRVVVPHWTSGEKALHVVLSTAFSLQPRAWSIGVAGAGESQ